MLMMLSEWMGSLARLLLIGLLCCVPSCGDTDSVDAFETCSGGSEIALVLRAGQLSGIRSPAEIFAAGLGPALVAVRGNCEYLGFGQREAQPGFGGLGVVRGMLSDDEAKDIVHRLRLREIDQRSGISTSDCAGSASHPEILEVSYYSQTQSCACGCGTLPGWEEQVAARDLLFDLIERASPRESTADRIRVAVFRLSDGIDEQLPVFSLPASLHDLASRAQEYARSRCPFESIVLTGSELIQIREVLAQHQESPDLHRAHYVQFVDAGGDYYGGVARDEFTEQSLDALRALPLHYYGCDEGTIGDGQATR